MLSAIDNARSKYPDFTQWKYEVLEYCDISSLNEREKYYIEYYKSYDQNNGYNLTKGGEGTNGVIPSSAFKKGRIRTEQEIAKYKETLKLHKEQGLINFGRGKRVCSWKGKHRPTDTKKKISEALKGNIPWNKGITGFFSEDSLLSNKEKHKPTPILQFTLNGEFVKRWEYMSDAAKELGICKNNISACVRHYKNVKSAGGYIWEYAK